MQVRTITRALVVVAACTMAGNAFGRSWEQTPRTHSEASSTSVLLGYKQLKESDWEPADQQISIGIDYGRKPAGWPMGVATRFLVNYGKETNVDVEAKSWSTEVHVGARKVFYNDSFWRFRPYVDAGVAVALAHTETTDAGENRSAIGYGGGIWAGGGFHLQFSEAFSVGFDSRWSKIPMNLSGDSVDSGGLFLGVSLGYHWYGH
jgi:hypothetical protein